MHKDTNPRGPGSGSLGAPGIGGHGVPTPGTGRPGPIHRLLTWLLLRFYPAAFRAEWGPGLIQCLDEILETEGTGGTLQASRIWIGAFWDAVTEGTRERVSAMRRRFGSGRNPSGTPGPEHRRPTRATGGGGIETLMRDTRHAMRALLKRPGFTAVSALTLAIGIGATSAIFSIVNGVLLEPLPLPEPDRLVGLWHVAPGMRSDEINQSGVTYFVYKENNRVFENVALWDNRTTAVTGLDEPERVRSLLVTESFLPTLGIPMQLGRPFSPDDDQPGVGGTVVLTDDYWRSRLGADPGVLGRTLTLDGRPHEIIGVLGPELRSLMPGYQLLTPARFDRGHLNNGSFSYQAFARLRDDVTLAEATTDLTRVMPLMTGFEGPITPSFLEEAQFAPVVRPLKDDVIKDAGSVLWMLLGAVGIILLIAVANVANLFLVRSQGGQTEIAVRTALGAGRRAILRTFLLESGILGLMGGALGLVFAWGSLRALVAVAPDRTPRIADIGLDPTTLVFALVLSLGAGLLFGLMPVVRYGRPELSSALKEGSRGSGTGREPQRLRSGLVVAQMAMALLLLVGSGLMLRSFSALRAVDPGFSDPGTLVTVRVSLPVGEVPDTEDVGRVHEQINRALEQMTSVTSAGIASSVAMDGNDNNYAVLPEHVPYEEGDVPPIHRSKEIGGEYFRTLGIPLLAGRVMEAADLADRRPVVVVNESFARTYWTDPQAALGKRLRTFNDARLAWYEIVGVVGDVRDDGMDQDKRAIAYFPMVGANEQGEPFSTRTLSHVVRSPRGAALIPQARDAVWSVNPNLALTSLQTHQVVVDESLARTSFTMVVLGVAAGVALLLGTVGIYGVISYIVGQRTREIGVRMALGADRSRVSRMVVRDGMRLAGLGVGIGLVVAIGLTRVMSALLFEVSPLDPVTFVGVTAVLAGVAALAAWLPARRAASVEPGVVLRGE
jgi:predicted permease